MMARRLNQSLRFSRVTRRMIAHRDVAASIRHVCGVALVNRMSVDPPIRHRIGSAGVTGGRNFIGLVHRFPISHHAVWEPWLIFLDTGPQLCNKNIYSNTYKSRIMIVTITSLHEEKSKDKIKIEFKDGHTMITN